MFGINTVTSLCKEDFILISITNPILSLPLGSKHWLKVGNMFPDLQLTALGWRPPPRRFRWLTHYRKCSPQCNGYYIGSKVMGISESTTFYLPPHRALSPQHLPHMHIFFPKIQAFFKYTICLLTVFEIFLKFTHLWWVWLRSVALHIGEWTFSQDSWLLVPLLLSCCWTLDKAFKHPMLLHLTSGY